jgi:hypothetical protein
LGPLGLGDQGGEVSALIFAYLLDLFPHLPLEGHPARRTVLDCPQVDPPHSQRIQLLLHVLCLLDVVLQVVFYSYLDRTGATR